MQHRQFISRINHTFKLGLLSILLILLGLSSQSGFTKNNQPNLLFITIDTLRADHISSYGYQNINTKNINALATGGLLFTNFYSHSPWTRPSFATFFTSLYPSQHGAEMNNLTSVNRKLDNENLTLAEILRDNGYVTAAFQGNANAAEKYGFDQGFDLFAKSSLHHGDGLPYPPAKRMYQGFKSWLANNKHRKFFVWINYMDPHMPYAPPKKYYQDLWDPNYKGQVTNPFRNYKIGRSGPLLTKKDKEQIHRLYEAEIRHIDDYIGKTIALLNQTKTADNTLIILSSDHGEEFWEHGGASNQELEDFNWGFGHGHTLYDEQIHLPLIIRYPKEFGTPGEISKIDQQVRQVDFLPTILDILKIHSKNETVFEGQSLLPLIKGEKYQTHEVYSESILYGKEKKAIRTKKYKLIYHIETEDIELYDLQKDFGETENIAKAHPKIVKSLKDRLLRWMERVKPVTNRENLNQNDSQLKELLDKLGY